MPTPSERLRRLEDDLNDCTDVAQAIAIDSGADDPQDDVPRRASVLESALRAAVQDVQDLRAQVAGG